jgi:hypothetical protein
MSPKNIKIQNSNTMPTDTLRQRSANEVEFGWKFGNQNSVAKPYKVFVGDFVAPAKEEEEVRIVFFIKS